MNKEYMPLFLDFNETTQDLTDEECGRLIRAIVKYANGDESYTDHMVGAEKIAFRFMKGQVDRNNLISKARTEAIKARWSQDCIDNEIQNDTNEYKAIQNDTKDTTKTQKPKTKTNTKTNTNTKTETDTMFDTFWSNYPRHEAKQAARKAFDKLHPDDELMQIILEALAKWRKSEQWQKEDGRYIPMPASWLNGRRWEDEAPRSGGSSHKVIAQDYEQRDYSQERESYDEMLERLGI